MPLFQQSMDADVERTGPAFSVQYSPEAFRQRLEAIMADGSNRSGRCFLFYGGTREKRQEALGSLSRYAAGNIHQFRMPSLLNEYRMQTQNSLRKAFDHAAEENALLYFDRVDPLFTHDHADTPDNPKREAVPTTVEYFFDRVAAFEGMVVLALQRKRHVEWARDKVDLLVRFE